MGPGQTKHQVIIAAGAALMVVSCSVAAFAASQLALRHHFLASLGYVAQTVDWELPDPGFAWTVVSDLEIAYSWDWVPAASWPEIGNPPSSYYSEIHYRNLNSLSDQGAFSSAYDVMQIGQSGYNGTVELRVTIQDLADDKIYECHAFSSQSTDAYYNTMMHAIDGYDWTIIDVTGSP